MFVKTKKKKKLEEEQKEKKKKYLFSKFQSMKIFLSSVKKIYIITRYIAYGL